MEIKYYDPKQIIPDYNDECGLLVYSISSRTDPVKTDVLIKGGVSDKRLKGFLMTQHALIAIGKTEDLKDAFMVATKTGEIQHYSIGEPALIVKNNDFELKNIMLRLDALDLGDKLSSFKLSEVTEKRAETEEEERKRIEEEER